MDFETETPAGYVTIEQAMQTSSDSWEHWELHPDTTIELNILDGYGDVSATVELTDRAAIQDMEEHMRDGQALMYGTQDGDRFEGVAYVDPWTPVRLVDER